MSTDNAQPRISHTKLAVLIWSIFFSAIFVFGWYKSAENNRDELAARNWEPRFIEFSKGGGARYQQLCQHFDSLHATPNSQHQLEAELNHGQPFANSRTASEAKFEWDDPKGGGHFVLEFRNGILVGESGRWDTDTILRVCGPQPTRASRENFAELVRRPLPSVGVYVWIASLACWAALRNWRVLIAQVSLAAALLAGMAWLVDPGYSVTSQGIFSNDNLFFAALMLLVSAGLLGLSIARRPSSWQLRFGLFDLLAAVTAAAILLAIGPFGYVTLFAGLEIAIVFVAFLYIFRMPAHLPQ